MAKSETELLEEVARDGSMDYSGWPELLGYVTRRIDQICRHDFPRPRVIPLPERSTNSIQVPNTHADGSSSQEDSSQSSQTANKENAPPATSPTRIRPPIPLFSSATGRLNSTSAAEDELPEPVNSTLASIQKNLTTNFPNAPPHTIQRLAELVLRPRVHYRTLISYLRALDRVVSVSSTANVFPLPTANMTGSPETSLNNGTSTIIGGGGSVGGLGSDESLGGALLTPIPWLRPESASEVRTESTQIVQGPNGVGSVETVSVYVRGVPSTLAEHAQQAEPLRESGAVTQGELLRQEQQAGVVPIAQLSARQTRSATARSEAESVADKMEEDERPHARGPEEVGMQDMGPQDAGVSKGTFDIDAALGRKPARKDESEMDVDTDDASIIKEGSKDQGVVLADAQGKPETVPAEKVASGAAFANDNDVEEL
ncbi:MAG: hypothetical protein M1825_000491 [Sarcosagium campestre]|nr:MAG: hypothetical protein M1825_000491 [Sarcosagium campestre]